MLWFTYSLGAIDYNFELYFLLPFTSVTLTFQLKEECNLNNCKLYAPDETSL